MTRPAVYATIPGLTAAFNWSIPEGEASETGYLVLQWSGAEPGESIDGCNPGSRVVEERRKKTPKEKELPGIDTF